MDDEDIRQKLDGTLRQVVQLRDVYEQIRVVSPANGSPGATDVALQFGAWPWILATNSWIVGADHAHTWYVLNVVNMLPMAAHYSMARGAIEAGVVCRWLLDPSVDSYERRRRGAIAQLDDYRNQRAFESDIQASTPKASAGRAASQYRELEATLKMLGIKSESPPSMIELYDRYASGGWLYRFLSAHAHGKNWGVLSGAMVDLDRWPGAADTVMAMSVSANHETTLAAAEYALRTLASAVADMARYVAPLDDGERGSPDASATS